MLKTFARSRWQAALAGASVAALASAAPAAAQETANTEDEDTEAGEIIVTGTFLRGVAPAGANVLSYGAEDVESTGALGTNELLANIPQVSNYFNQVQTPGVNVSGANDAAGLSINQYFQVLTPNVRNLPGISSGDATLVLVDGHRVVGAGVTQNAVDPDIVPPGIIERVEIVTDGGSALYGADAVGGVINFVTRRSFDGVRVDAHYGFADDYETYDTNITLGQEWAGGGAYISYNYAAHSELLGMDRDYMESLDWTTGVPTGRSCADPNIVVGLNNYAYPSPLTVGSVNACDTTDYQSMTPEETRHSFFAGFSQDLTEAITFDLRAFFTERDTYGTGQPQTGNVSIAPSNPFYVNLPAPDANDTQRVLFNYFPVQGAQARDTSLQWFGITPSLAIDLGPDWQLRALVNYGYSESMYRNQAVNRTLEALYAAGITENTAINYYDLAATPNQALIDEVLDWQDAGFSNQDLLNMRAVVDGPLFTLPGGEVRAALGAEYIEQSYKRRLGETVLYGEEALPWRGNQRSVTAIFGEFQIPIVGPQNDIPLMESLSLSLAVRHDDYSTFGETTNPKVGLTYEPVEWLRIRASWGESFNAPTLSQTLGGGSTLTIQNGFRVPPPGDPAPPAGLYAIVLTGSVPTIQPQDATTYSVGFDIEPPFMPGVTASVSYYNIEFRGILSRVPIFDAVQMYSFFPDYVTLGPFDDDADILDFPGMTDVPNYQALLAPYLGDAGRAQVYQIMDYRLRNLGDEKFDGLDFTVRYAYDAEWGGFDAGITGTYPIERARRSGNAPFADIDLDQTSRLRFAADVGARFDNFTARATYNYNSGYDVVRTSTLPQDEVDAFKTVDLYFRYDFNGTDVTRDLAVTMNVNNVFEEDPPEYRFTGGSGVINGTTLGRLITLGVSKTF